MNRATNLFRLLGVLCTIVVFSSGALAATLYDVPTQTMGSSGSFAQCVWARYNATETVTVFGISKFGSSTPTRAFFYNGSNGADNGNCATGNASYVASCTFSGNNCFFNANITKTVGSNWTIAIDNAGGAWTQNYGTAGELPAYGNTSKVRWLGDCSNGAGAGCLDTTPRSINGIFYLANDPVAPVITVSLNNLVNGSSWPSSVTFGNVTGSLTFNYFNITGSGYCVSYTGNGTGTNCTSGNGASTFYNVTNTTTITGTQSVSASTYQALISLSAYRLYLNTSISTFNATNAVYFNSTTTGSVVLAALTGSNNVIARVLGNYTKNVTCTVGAALTTTSCNVTGIFDNLFTIGASFNGAGIQNFNVSVTNDTLGGTLYASTTTNGSILFSLLQGYAYNFSFRSVNYTSQSALLVANASTNLYNFTTLEARKLNFIFRNELTRAIINSTNMTLEIISDVYATNVSATTGNITHTILFPSEYTFRYRGGNYTERQYFLNVTDETSGNVTLYVIELASADLISVTVSDTGANLLQDVTVKLLRYFIYCNCYEVVEMEKTSFEGTTSLWAQPLEGHYKWAVDYNNINYFISTVPETIISDTKFFSIDLGQSYYASYQDVSGIGSAIVLNTTSGAISFSWSDPTGSTTGACITAYRFVGSIETEYSQSCASGSTGGVLTTINVTDGKSYKYVASVTNSNTYSNTVVIANGYFDPDFDFDFGTMGIWLSIVLLIVVALMFSYSVPALLVSATFVIVIVNILGLLTFTTSFISGIVAVFLGIVVFLVRS